MRYLFQLMSEKDTKVQREIFQYESNKWQNFINKLGPYPVKSSIFWNKINEVKAPKQASSIPNLLYDGISYKTDSDKATLFSSILTDTFSDINNLDEFDGANLIEVNNVVDNLNLSDCEFKPFNTFEIFYSQIFHTTLLTKFSLNW